MGAIIRFGVQEEKEVIMLDTLCPIWSLYIPAGRGVVNLRIPLCRRKKKAQVFPNLPSNNPYPII